MKVEELLTGRELGGVVVLNMVMEPSPSTLSIPLPNVLQNKSFALFKSLSF